MKDSRHEVHQEEKVKKDEESRHEVYQDREWMGGE